MIERTHVTIINKTAMIFAVVVVLFRPCSRSELTQNYWAFSVLNLIEISIPQGKGMGMFDCRAALRLRLKWPIKKKLRADRPHTHTPN